MKLTKLKTLPALLAGLSLILAASCSTESEEETTPLYSKYTAGPRTLEAIASIAAAMEYGNYTSEAITIDDASLNFDTSGNFTLTIEYTYGETLGGAASAHKIKVAGSYSVDSESSIALAPLTLTDTRFFNVEMNAETSDNLAALFELIENAEITIEDDAITAALAIDGEDYELTFSK